MCWCHAELVSASHPTEFKYVYVTLKRVQGDVVSIIANNRHSSFDK